MNYRGSYRRLLGNSRSAVLAAIEIYNKPRFEYRDECFVILLMNGWIAVTASDPQADYLVWVDYAARLMGDGSVEILLFDGAVSTTYGSGRSHSAG